MGQTEIPALTCTGLHGKETASGNLLHGRGSAQRSVITQRSGSGAGGRRLRGEGVCAHAWLIHAGVEQKPAQHCEIILLPVLQKINVHNVILMTFMIIFY